MDLRGKKNMDICLKASLPNVVLDHWGELIKQVVLIKMKIGTTLSRETTTKGETMTR